MTKSTITRERLAKIKSWRETYGAGSNVMLPAEEAEELARIALAALDSEPVAWTWQHLKQWHVTNDEERARDLAWDGVKVEPLYRHAQLAPVVPDEMLCEFYEVDSWPDLVRELVKQVEQLQDSAKRNVKPWEDTFPETLLPVYIEKVKQADEVCRSAMLQAGTLTNEGTIQAGNSPVIGIDLASGPDRTVEVRYVAPPGYVMVPKEPTKEMINAGWLYYMGTKNPSSKGTYKAMLAAAPQEVKP